MPSEQQSGCFSCCVFTLSFHICFRLQTYVMLLSKLPLGQVPMAEIETHFGCSLRRWGALSYVTHHVIIVEEKLIVCLVFH